MSVIVIFLLAAFTTLNSMAAKKKGHNALLWAFVSIVAFFIFLFIGTTIMLLVLAKGDLLALSQQPDYIKKMNAFFVDNVLNQVTLMAIAFGGFLLVHFIISRLKPVQNNRPNMPN